MDAVFDRNREEDRKCKNNMFIRCKQYSFKSTVLSKFHDTLWYNYTISKIVKKRPYICSRTIDM